MPDEELRAKVVKGLDCCLQQEFGCNATECPYIHKNEGIDMDCTKELHDDAITLIRSLESGGVDRGQPQKSAGGIEINGPEVDE